MKAQTTIDEEVYRLLCIEYGTPSFKLADPLEQVVRTILSQQTTSQNTRKAYEQLRSTFPDWQSLLDSPTQGVEDTIRVAGLAPQKAPRIQALLAKVQADFGAFSLEALHGYSNDEALSYLLSLPGVGQKTARCVLIFALNRQSIPVDTHVHRLAQRLCWVPTGTSAEETAQLLEKYLSQNIKSALHVLLFEHGRKICTARNPKCNQCTIAGICPQQHT